MPALPYDEVSGCIDRIKASKGASASSKLAFEFLVLTAARSGEVRKATREEIDVAGAVWKLPAERMKANREHRVPLSGRALEVLAEAAELSEDTDLLFPGTRRGRPLSENTHSKLLRELGFDAMTHGFRSSFRTWASEQTHTPHAVMEAALAHTVRNRVGAAYAPSDLFEKRRELMESWADYLVADGKCPLIAGGPKSTFQTCEGIGHCLDDRDSLHAHVNDAADGGHEIAGIVEPSVRVVDDAALGVRLHMVAVDEPTQRRAPVDFVLVRLWRDAGQADMLVDDQRAAAVRQAHLSRAQSILLRRCLATSREIEA